MNRCHVDLPWNVIVTNEEMTLFSTEGAIATGSDEMWNGYTLLGLTEVIRRVYGRLCTAHDSQEFLLEMEQAAEDDPDKIQFTSAFIRRLALSAMQMTDTGFLYTRGEKGKEKAVQNRQKYEYIQKLVADMTTDDVDRQLADFGLLDSLQGMAAVMDELSFPFCRNITARKMLAEEMLRWNRDHSKGGHHE